MKKSYRNRLDAHFGVCTAMAAAAAIAGSGEKADAAVVYSGVVNIPLPNNVFGVYMNLVTGVTAAAGFAGQDVNFYYAGNNAWMANLTNNSAVGPVAGPAQDVPVSTSISAASTFVNLVYPPMANFTANGQHVFGLRFLNEGTAATNYGWIRINRTNATTAVIVDYGYENTGAPVSAANNCAALLPHPSCIADVNNSGSIDVNDLLAVISGWGQVGPMKPVADVAPGLTGDCTVNVNDLLAVIGGWGACPIPTGACCIPGPVATCNSVSAAVCATTGGNFQGNGSTCPNAACVAGPANDNPAGAFTMNVGTTAVPLCTNTGSNVGATLTAAPALPACVSTVMTRDVWFKYTVPSTPGLFGQVLSINTCNNVNPFNDTTLGVYTFIGGVYTEIACNDDACGVVGFSSRVLTPMVNAGVQIYVRLGSWSTGAADEGPYVICAGAQDITQDICLGAETLNIGASDADFLNTATQDQAPTCRQTGGGPSVSAGVGKWYKVTGNGQTLTVTTCGSSNAGGQGIYDGKITVYCGASCGGLICAAATDADQGGPQGPACPAFQGETVAWCSAVGQTYWVLVAAANLPAGQNGTYNVALSANGVACSTTLVCGPPPPPANDDCAGATTVLVGATPFSNVSATPVTTIPLCGTTSSKDVWFKYTSLNGGAVHIQFTGVAPFLDGVAQVYTGTCAALTPVPGTCVDDPATTATCTGCGACMPCIDFTAVAGTTYTIEIGNWDVTAAGLATMTITDP